MHLLICDLSHAVGNRAWLLQVTTVLRLLWFHRNARIHDPARSPATGFLSRCESQVHTRLRTDKEAYRNTMGGAELYAIHRLLDAIILQVTSPISLLSSEPRSSDHWALLFFDGGSRGNPGPRGAGACIVTFASGQPSIVWAQATFLPDPKTTNNGAELVGVLTGLRALRLVAHSACSIIGDSNLILSFLRRHKAPKAPHLKENYWQARRIADSLPVRDWCHHFRAHNAMADLLANHAMDTRATTTIWPSRTPLSPSLQALLTRLQTLCMTDLQPWLLNAVEWRPP
jgi:ribonuclease HI